MSRARCHTPRPRYHVSDHQAELLPRLREAKARAALYAHCERAPLGWEKRT